MCGNDAGAKLCESWAKRATTKLPVDRPVHKQIAEVGSRLPEVLDEHLAGFRAECPDYLITDSVAPWGQWAGEILGVPVVTSVSTFAFNRRVLAFAAAHGIRPRSVQLFLSKLRHIVKALRLRSQLPCPRAWNRGLGDGSLRLEYCLYVVPFSALCGNV